MLRPFELLELSQKRSPQALPRHFCRRKDITQLHPGKATKNGQGVPQTGLLLRLLNF